MKPSDSASALAVAQIALDLIDWLMDHDKLRPYLENIDGVYARMCVDYDRINEAKTNEPPDPTPWCLGCGAMQKASCHCGPIADND